MTDHSTNPKRPEHIEDIPDHPISVDDSLSDEELRAGGMVPVGGWMRTRSSRNAERVKKAKAKAASGEDGKTPRRQLNLQAPTDEASRTALKQVSERLLAGDLEPADLDVLGRVDTMRLGIKAGQVYAAGGWRAAFLRKLLG